MEQNGHLGSEMPVELIDTLTPERDQPQAPRPSSSEQIRCTGELAECTCPDFCERDHANE